MAFHVRTYALHIQPEGAAILVNATSRYAGVLVAVVKYENFPAFILVADSEALGRTVQCGGTALMGMSPAVAWCFENLPPQWMVGEGPFWCSLISMRMVYSVRAARHSEVKWTPVRWPGCPQGSFSALRSAFPEFASPALSALEAMG